MEILLQLILLIIIVAIFFNLRLGIALFVSYSFLVPYCKLDFGGTVLQQNLINTIVLLSVCLNIKHINIRPFVAFVVFYILILFLIPFANGVDIEYQLDRWRSMVMGNLLVPIALWNMHSMKNAYLSTRHCLIGAVTIACIYGIFLTTMNGVNPYIMFINAINGNEYRLEWFSSEGRLFGRISSVFTHPMTYGMFLGCSFIYVYSIKEKISKNLFNILLFLLAVNIVIIGVRSLLFASFITYLFFLFLCRKKKVMVSAVGLAILFFLMVYIVPELRNYFQKISDISDQNDIGGSNLDMRLAQLEGCFNEIRDCFWVGKGNSWHENYMEKNYLHPTILGFESLLFLIICDYGILGFCIYGIMIWILLYTQKKYIAYPLNRVILSCFIVFYLSYCLFTGDYSYMKIWLFFYFLTFSEMYKKQNEETEQLRE